MKKDCRMSLNFVNADGQKIFTRSWQPQQAGRGVVLIAHGLGEHSGRYEHVGQKLADAGYHAYALDHLGHGQSEGKRVQVRNHSDFIRDLRQFYDKVRQQHPDHKPYLLGHSMGSVISLQFTLNNPDTLKALIVTGTATDVGSTVSTALRSVVRFVVRVAPGMPVSPALDDPKRLTSDPEMQQKWHADPLVNRGATPASIATYIVETGEMIQNRASELKLPILIMHGEADQITPISGSRIVHQRAGSADKTLVTYPGMQHEIMNEVEREKVLGRILDWLSQH
jgi:alpha-beta hydrolase superfamily lysophospholipase